MKILATGPSGPLHEQILAAARGEAPAHCVNPEAIPRWRTRR